MSARIIQLSMSIVGMDGFEDLFTTLGRDFSSPIDVPGPELLVEIAARIGTGCWRKARDRGELEQRFQDWLDRDPGLLRHGMVTYAVLGISAECTEALKHQKGLACTAAPKSTGKATVALLSGTLRGWLRACSAPHDHPETQVVLRLILADLADTAPSAFENLRYARSKDEIEAEAVAD